MGIPRFILALFVIDAALGFAYLGNLAIGRPSDTLSHLVDLDGEANIPAWYASVQWFAVAAVAFVVADQRMTRQAVRSWALWLLPLLFLAFSMDEVVQAHEFVGVQTDVLLPGGTRDDTVVPLTGLFIVTVGLPFVFLLAALLAIVRSHLRQPPRAFTMLAVGMALMLTGAIGLDFLSNFIDQASPLAFIEIYFEESLEMFGATIVLWATCQFAILPAASGVGSS